jgi:hypothetical protein
MMLSRSYRRAAADERRAARRAAVTSSITGKPSVDDAALGWLAETTAVLVLIAFCVLAVGGFEAADHSVRSIPLFLVGLVGLVAAVRSGARLVMLRRQRRHNLDTRSHGR